MWSSMLFDALMKFVKNEYFTWISSKKWKESFEDETNKHRTKLIIVFKISRLNDWPQGVLGEAIG